MRAKISFATIALWKNIPDFWQETTEDQNPIISWKTVTQNTDNLESQYENREGKADVFGTKAWFWLQLLRKSRRS